MFPEIRVKVNKMCENPLKKSDATAYHFTLSKTL